MKHAIIILLFFIKTEDEYEKYTDEKCVIEYIYVLPSKRNLLVAYELMKKLIDELDDFLANVYGLTDEELLYIKAYKENYRLGIDNQ